MYNTTGAGQTRLGGAVQGQSVTYYVSAQNDSLEADGLRLQGTASTRRFGVRYLRGTTDITAAVTAGTHLTPVLATGAAQTIRVVVTVRATAEAPGSLVGTLVVRSRATPATRDTVRFVTSIP